MHHPGASLYDEVHGIAGVILTHDTVIGCGLLPIEQIDAANDFIIREIPEK